MNVVDDFELLVFDTVLHQGLNWNEREIIVVQSFRTRRLRLRYSVDGMQALLQCLTPAGFAVRARKGFLDNIFFIERTKEQFTDRLALSFFLLGNLVVFESLGFHFLY